MIVFKFPSVISHKKGNHVWEKVRKVMIIIKKQLEIFDRMYIALGSMDHLILEI